MSETETKRVVVEGEPEEGPSPRPARTPRDFAINKTKEGEDVGLESSKPDHSERFFVTARVAAKGRFVDADGNVWEMTGKRKDRPTVLSRSAILKDGGDPSLLNIPDEDDKFEVTGPVGNETLTRSGVLDSESGEVTLPEDPDDDDENIESVDRSELGTAKPVATPHETAQERSGKARGKAEKKASSKKATKRKK